MTDQITPPPVRPENLPDGVFLFVILCHQGRKHLTDLMYEIGRAFAGTIVSHPGIGQIEQFGRLCESEIQIELLAG